MKYTITNKIMALIIIVALIVISAILYNTVFKVEKVKTLKDAEIGNIVEFGSYEQDNNPKEKEAIRWIVIDKQDNKLYLLSEKIIDVKQYEENESGCIQWSDSSLRKWLNNDFLDESFSEEEVEKIISDNQDEVSILSYDDVEKYLIESNYLLAQPSIFADENGLFYNAETKASNWWIKKNNYAASVESDGMILGLNNNGYEIAPEGVRPCMWVEVN